MHNLHARSSEYISQSTSESDPHAKSQKAQALLGGANKTPVHIQVKPTNWGNKFVCYTFDKVLINSKIYKHSPPKNSNLIETTGKTLNIYPKKTYQCLTDMKNSSTLHIIRKMQIKISMRLSLHAYQRGLNSRDWKQIMAGMKRKWKSSMLMMEM